MGLLPQLSVRFLEILHSVDQASIHFYHISVKSNLDGVMFHIITYIVIHMYVIHMNKISLSPLMTTLSGDGS